MSRTNKNFRPPIQVPREEMADVKQIIGGVQVAGKNLFRLSVVAGATNLVARYSGHQQNQALFDIVHTVSCLGLATGYTLSQVGSRKVVAEPLPHPREQARKASKNQQPRIHNRGIASNSATETCDIGGGTLPAIELNDNEESLLNGLNSNQFRGLKKDTVLHLIETHLRPQGFKAFATELWNHANQLNAFNGKNAPKLKALTAFLNTERQKFQS